MNETKFWLNGLMWGGTQITANNEGTTAYWLNGLMYGDVFIAPTFVPYIMWFM